MQVIGLAQFLLKIVKAHIRSLLKDLILNKRNIMKIKIIVFVIAFALQKSEFG
jgi:hypothetical protein